MFSLEFSKTITSKIQDRRGNDGMVNNQKMMQTENLTRTASQSDDRAHDVWRKLQVRKSLCLLKGYKSVSRLMTTQEMKRR